MARTPFICGNWKLHKTVAESLDLATAIKNACGPLRDVEVAVAPVFTALHAVAKRLEGSAVAVAAQNCFWEDQGAWTGEVSCKLLADVGCTYVIIGHSERRNVFGENDALIGRKLALAIETGLTPIFCIGEDQNARDRGRQSIVVSDQIKVVEAAVPATAGEVIVAYEPVWAIGTGRNATGTMVAEMVAEIRAALGRFWPPQFAQQAPVLYGGSVTPENIDDLIGGGNVDGFLVGGASLDSRKFLAIAAVL